MKPFAIISPQLLPHHKISISYLQPINPSTIITTAHASPIHKMQVQPHIVPVRSRITSQKKKEVHVVDRTQASKIRGNSTRNKMKAVSNQQEDRQRTQSGIESSLVQSMYSHRHNGYHRVPIFQHGRQTLDVPDIDDDSRLMDRLKNARSHIEKQSQKSHNSVVQSKLVSMEDSKSNINNSNSHLKDLVKQQNSIVENKAPKKISLNNSNVIIQGNNANGQQVEYSSLYHMLDKSQSQQQESPNPNINQSRINNQNNNKIISDRQSERMGQSKRSVSGGSQIHSQNEDNLIINGSNYSSQNKVTNKKPIFSKQNKIHHADIIHQHQQQHPNINQQKTAQPIKINNNNKQVGDTTTRMTIQNHVNEHIIYNHQQQLSQTRRRQSQKINNRNNSQKDSPNPQTIKKQPSYSNQSNLGSQSNPPDNLSQIDIIEDSGIYSLPQSRASVRYGYGDTNLDRGSGGNMDALSCDHKNNIRQKEREAVSYGIKYVEEGQKQERQQRGFKKIVGIGKSRSRRSKESSRIQDDNYDNSGIHKLGGKHNRIQQDFIMPKILTLKPKPSNRTNPYLTNRDGEPSVEYNKYINLIESQRSEGSSSQMSIEVIKIHRLEPFKI